MEGTHSMKKTRTKKTRTKKLGMKKLIAAASTLIAAAIVWLGQSCGIINLTANDNEASRQEQTQEQKQTSSQERTSGQKQKSNQNQKQKTTEALTDTERIEAALMAEGVPSQMLVRDGYITSYNKETRCPNWVGWHLTAEHCQNGGIERDGVPYYDEDGNAIGIGKLTSKTTRNCYIVDKDVPSPRQELDDWTNNRYKMSHGHMCPAADCDWSKAAINQSFLLTNMCPQNSSLNSGDWRVLEERCRKWAEKYGDVYIVAGPVFDSNTTRTIGDNRIAVPDAFFKVVLHLGNKPQALGFIYANEAAQHDMKHYVLTVDEVEAKTGIDFFSSLSDDIETAVEAHADINVW